MPVLSEWLQVVDWAHSVSMATGDGPGPYYQHGYRWWTGPVFSAWLQVVDYANAVCMASEWWTGSSLSAYLQMMFHQ